MNNTTKDSHQCAYFVGRVIKAARMALSLTQADLAAKTGVCSQVVVSQWETGRARPNQQTVTLLAMLLELDERDLLYGLGYVPADEQNSAVDRLEATIERHPHLASRLRGDRASGAI